MTARTAEVMASLLFGLATLALAIAIAGVPAARAPAFGRRGKARKRALARGGLFSCVEPLIRFIAGLVAFVASPERRENIEIELVRAEHWLGLAPDEYTALRLISAPIVGAVAWSLARAGGASWVLALPGVVLGFMLPRLHVLELARRRSKEISRGLPHAIEIAAMCLDAGLDFPGALRALSDSARGHADALSREFLQVLEELELGRTRRQALLAFSERVPTEPVREFVMAIVQADQKGNPLARAIRIQGRLLSTRRSVAAEEAAARAGVLMVIPLMLLVGAVLLLLVGPLIVKGVGF